MDGSFVIERRFALLSLFIEPFVEADGRSYVFVVTDGRRLGMMPWAWSMPERTTRYNDNVRLPSKSQSGCAKGCCDKVTCLWMRIEIQKWQQGICQRVRRREREAGISASAGHPG